MRIRILAGTVSILLCGAAGAADTMHVGDGQIDGRKIRPYELTWRQCALQGEEWVDMGDLTETMVVIGDKTLRHQQRVHRADGIEATTTTYFERSTFAPLRIERNVVAADGSLMGRSAHSLNAEGYSGWSRRGEESKEVQGTITSNMLNGSALGLPLATLSYRDDALQFAASMLNFDASYQVEATWAGKETVDFEGTKVEAWLVDLEWVHEGLGDIYPPGPDASGGRFWIVTSPPDGFPYVLRYKTDTYAVEFIEATCPAAAAELE